MVGKACVNRSHCCCSTLRAASTSSIVKVSRTTAQGFRDPPLCGPSPPVRTAGMPSTARLASRSLNLRPQETRRPLKQRNDLQLPNLAPVKADWYPDEISSIGPSQSTSQIADPVPSTHLASVDPLGIRIDFHLLTLSSPLGL